MPENISFSELREHSSTCRGNLFDDNGDDATNLSTVTNGGPNSSNNSTQSSLNIPISIAAQQPVNVHTTSSQQSSQPVPSQHHPLQEDSMNRCPRHCILVHLNMH